MKASNCNTGRAFTFRSNWRAVGRDVLLLKRVGKSVDFTLGGAYGLVKYAPQYKYIINGSIAIHF